MVDDTYMDGTANNHLFYVNEKAVN